MENNYTSEDYINPLQTYARISDKIKIGHLLYNRETDGYIAVDLKVLGEIQEFENNENEAQKYFPIPLNEFWLSVVFKFEKKELHSGIYFTSLLHGFKITKQGGRYLFGYTLREKGFGGSATFNLRPQFLFVHELMDLLFLMRREQFKWTVEDLKKIKSNLHK